jgi:hypothetical protein
MFNLESAITEWRRRMASAGVKSPALLDELESHLRDDIDQRRKNGLDLEQSFQAAVDDVGQPAFIQSEFKKNRPDKVAKAISIAALVMYTLACLPLFFSPILDATSSEKMSGFFAILVTGTLILAVDHTWRILPIIRAKNRRMIIGIVCAVLGAMVPMVLFNNVVPRYDLNSAQIVLITLWALIPTLIGGAVLAGLNEAAKRRLA